MTDTLKSMRNRGNLRGRKRTCSDSLNLKKYEIVNYYSYQLILHNIEILTYKKHNIELWNVNFYIKWNLDHFALKQHEDIELHNAWKILFELTRK